jgi:hypothetical protein
MNYRNLGLNVLILCILFCANTAAEDVITQADKSVVRILVFKSEKGISTGTGFVVGRGGIVATNNHVVRGGDNFIVLSKRAQGVQHFQAEVSWVSSDYDLALLKVTGLEAPPLLIAEKIPEKGSRVTTIGYPGAADSEINFDLSNLAESTLTQGIVGRITREAYSQEGKKQTILQHSASVNSGNSGGPLLDACGRVVGVNTAKARGEVLGNAETGLSVNSTDGIYFASHVSVLLSALKERGVNAIVASDDCIPEGSTSITQSGVEPNQQGAYLSLVIVAAFLVAFGALYIAMRKSTIIHETYTQYRKRSLGATDLPAKKPLNWAFRGQNSRGQTVELNFDPVRLDKGPMIIGREAIQSQLVLDDLTVSRRHAKISLISGYLHIIDLGSANGTWIDAEPVTSNPIRLRRGQTLTLGKVILTIDYPELAQ